MLALTFSAAAFVWIAAVSQGASTGEGTGGLPAVMSLDTPFSVTGPPSATQLAKDAESRTQFQGLGRTDAVALAARDFQVSRPTWSAIGSEGDGHVDSYLGDFAAVMGLPSGGHDVLSSTIPLRVATAKGLAPTSLALEQTEGGYVPENPVVPVVISAHATGGISLPGEIAVSPTGVSESESPTVTGNSVMFTNVEPDTDLISQPRPLGAELSWVLRSQSSPDQQQLVLHLPAGATMRAQSDDGGLEVFEEGKVALRMPAPIAHDAAGNPVPVAYTVSGDQLTMHENLGEDIQFPVLVDPLFIGEYGTYAGGNDWNGWESNSTHEPNCGTGNCFTFYDEPTYLEWGAGPGTPVYAEGAWGIKAPGYGAGASGITRVDLVGVDHTGPPDSQLVATIEESNGSAPVYSYNGTGGASGPLPLYEGRELIHQPIAFCAQGAGGYDGGSQPLCDEEHDQGSSFVIINKIVSPPTEYNWVSMEGAKVTYRDETYPNKSELTYTGGYDTEWVKTPSLTYTISGEDQGVGIKKLEIQAPFGHEALYQENVCNLEARGWHGCPNTYTSKAITFPGWTKTGVFELTPVVEDAANHVQPGNIVPMYVDKEPPAIALSGALGEAANGVVGEGSSPLTVTATDGSEGSPQSGVHSIEVLVDGKSVYSQNTSCPKPEGKPSGGCFALSGTWTMNGQTYGTGTHIVTVKAKDWVGNESEQTFSVTVNEAAYQQMGPGQVNLQTGDFRLNPTDVSVPAGAATLSVSRTFDSRKLTQGTEGPLGPQWAMSLPDSGAGEWQSLTPMPNGSITVIGAHGNQTSFTEKQSGGYSSPAGYQNDTLTKLSASLYKLTDAQGDYTEFKQPASGTAFLPATVGQATAAGGLNVVTYSFTKTSEGIVEPTEVLGPEPSKEACKTKLVAGCRALTFNYATTTTASGESPSQWGDYKGRLTRIFFTAGEGSPVTVAQFAWDKAGRLRAEWNPQVTPELKTYYGYDAEGHLTSVQAPGQEPWFMHYGSDRSDTNTGRLLSIARPQASGSLWSGEALTNTAAPTLSTTHPVVGTALSLSTGTWSGGSIAYGYQWERCNSSGSECSAIPGATNTSYTPLLSDVGHTIVGQITATNGGGSSTAVTAASSAVPAPAPSYSTAFGTSGAGTGQLSGPAGVALAPDGTVWVTDGGNHRLMHYSSTGSFLEGVGWGVRDGAHELETCTTSCRAGLGKSEGGKNGGKEFFGKLTGIAINQITGNIYVADAEADYIYELNSSGGLIRTIGLGAGEGAGYLSEPHGLAFDASWNLFVADTGNYRVEKFSETGSYLSAFGKKGKGAGEFEAPIGIAIMGGYIHVSDDVTDELQKFTEAGSYVGHAGEKGTGPGQFTNAWAFAYNAFSGYEYITSYGDGRMEVFTTSGGYVNQFGHQGSEAEAFNKPAGLAINPTSGTIYVADEGNNRIDIWAPTGPTTEPSQAPPATNGNSVSTIDYEVPLTEGEGRPNLTPTETAKWGQTDNPVEATAIFPPDEVEGWPAQDYKRATISYIDSSNRTVNVATPGGGVSTSEYYKATTNLSRTLTADNRAKAISEGTKEAEDAKLWDTEYTYSSDTTELTKVLGPQHRVKLPNSTEVLARKFTSYNYDEGLPSGEAGHLVTKTTEGTEETRNAKADEHTITDSYSGQSNLGWKLHRPTSVTTTTGARTLTVTTLYDEATGNVTETRSAGAQGNEHVNFLSKLKERTGEGTEETAKEPRGVALTPTNNIDLLDSGNNRVIEMNTVGETLAQFGAGTLSGPDGITSDGKGDMLIANTGANTIAEYNSKHEKTLSVGKAGTGLGEYKEPQGIAYSTTSKDIFIADTGNNRIVTLNEKGEPISAMGWGVKDGASKLEVCTSGCKAGLAGGGTGELNAPRGLAVMSTGLLWIADSGNNRLVAYNQGEYITTLTGHGLSTPSSVTSDGLGHLIVVNSGASDIVDVETTVNGNVLWSYGTLGSGAGQFNEPRAAALTASGDLFVADAKNNRADQLALAMYGNPGAHDIQTVYYTAASNSKYPSCGGHAEWAVLPCLERHGEQPSTGGLPNLTETTYTYNTWQEPVTTTDTAGSTTRTATSEYDNAGRQKTLSITGTAGTAVAPVTFEYSTTTGAPTKQNSTIEGKALSITQSHDTLGELTKYTDAGGNTASYEYETEKDDRLTKLTDGAGMAGESTQTFGYNTTTGLLATLKDSTAGTFTAIQDVEGNTTSVGYPNGMSANYQLSTTGAPIGLEYIKTTHCSSGCVWYTDSVVPSIHNQWITQTSTLSSELYKYDEAERLTETQETSAATKHCVARAYSLDEEGNRYTGKPVEGGSCATVETGSTTPHYYDSADRLMDPGVTYDPYSDITTLPAEDAGGTAWSGSYYVNGTLASQTQNGETINYTLDPAGRTRETISTGTTNTTVTNHYAGAGDSPAWAITGTGSWTRNIAGPAGSLAAIQENGAPAVLQLTDLHGDIVGTAAISETESKFTPTTETTEYGAPLGSIKSKYDWLGAAQRPTETPTGIINMGARTYIPQLGRFTQPDPSPGGSNNPYAYTNGDPVNRSDPTGNWEVTSNTNYEAAQAGEATVPIVGYIAPGALMPPPVDLKLEEEFVAHPPWTANAEYARTIVVASHVNSAVAFVAAPCARREDPNANGCSGSGQPLCLVRFARTTSSCSEVLLRAVEEYNSDNAGFDEILTALKEVIGGVKEASILIEEDFGVAEEILVSATTLP
jgi:RHS repeat-associated protein